VHADSYMWVRLAASAPPSWQLTGGVPGCWPGHPLLAARWAPTAAQDCP
jgi:hypothetical protein